MLVKFGVYLINHIYQMEMIQRRAVRFISNLKGRGGGVTSEQEALVLHLLQDGRDAKVRLLHKILSDDVHSFLKESFDSIAAQQTLYVPTGQGL